MKGLNCQIHRNPVTNRLQGVTAENGEQSILFQDALKRTGSEESALNIWSINYLDEVQEILKSNEENTQTQTIKRESGQISEIHEKLEDFIGGYDETIRTNDTQGTIGENLDRNRRESVAIKEFAKDNGFFIEDLTQDFIETEMGGSEADIYLDPSNNTVIKNFFPGAHNGFQGVLGRVLLHNMLFPETKYEIIGISEEGSLATLVLEQPFVEGGRNATQDEITNFIEKIGFEITSSTNGVLEAKNQEGVILGDLHGGNLLVKPDGTYHLIDPMISYTGQIPFTQFLQVKDRQTLVDSNGEATIQTVLNYINAFNSNEVPPINEVEKQTVKNMMMSAEINNSVDFNEELVKIFPQGTFSETELLKSKVFNRAEKDHILQNEGAQENLLTLSQQLSNLQEPLQIGVIEEEFIIYTNNKNKYGKIEVQNPEQVKEVIKQEVGGIKDRDIFDDTFNSLPYRSIVEKYNANSEFATEMFNQFSTLTEVQGKKVVDNQLVDDIESNRTTTVENSANLDKVSFNEDIDFISEVPTELWQEEEVEKALESLEKKGVEAAIDLEGLTDSLAYKTQEEITSFLDTLSTLEKEQTEENLKTFLEAYTEFFDVQEVTKVTKEEIAPEHSQKALRRVENPSSEYKMFTDFSLMKVSDGVYQLVTDNTNEGLYDALYAQTTRGESRLPEKAKSSSENRITAIAKIKNFVSGLISGENKIPNKYVQSVNPKTQASLITEYLKEKLGYNINVVSSEKAAEVLSNKGIDTNPITHNETVYGFHDPQTNEIYLTEEYLSSESLIHEMSHAYFPVIREQAAQGNKQAQLVLDKMEAAAIELLGEDHIKDRYERRKQDNNLNFSVAEGNKLFNSPLEEASSMVEEYFRNVLKTTEDVFDGVPSVNENRAKVIADLFDNMEENNDPQTIEAYEKMVEETVSQFEFIMSKGYTIEINNSEPYSSSGDMIRDLRENKNMKIFSTESGFGETPITEEQREKNPLLQKTQFKDKNGEPLLANDLFRFVHDFFGHSVLGNGFGPIGEENAWNVHARMYTPLARRAMTTETRGQNSWVNFSGANTEVFKKRDKARKLRKQGKIEEANRITNEVYEELKFADQKIGLLPEWVSDPYAEVTFGTQPFKELTPKQQAMMLGYSLDEKGSKIANPNGGFKYGKGEIVSINDVVDKSLMSPQEKRLLESSGIENIRMYGGRGSSEGILFYNRDTKEVHVNINNSLGGVVLTDQDMTNKFVLHELIHHIINDQVTDEASFNEELSKLRESLSNNKERASDYVKHIIGHMEAGSPEEVLTYMLTNKKVAEFMTTIPYDSKQPNKDSLWTQLIEFLTGVLKGNSLADEAVNILNKHTDSFWNNESQESKYKSVESFETTLKEGVWGMLTAENPNADGRAFTEEQNIQANEKAKEWLINKNYNPSEIQGMYGGNVENSFLVEGLTRQDALEFIREFNQESVATNEGYVYQDGTMNPINKDNIEIQGAFKDNYSTININGVNVSYKVDYDFSTTEGLNFKITGEENINDILSSAFAYDPRQGESFEEYRARMIDEAIAVIMQDNSVEYFENIAKENGLTEEQTKSFLQEIKDFIKQFSKWLSTQFGIDTVTEDTTNKQLYDAVTTSMLRGDLVTNSPTLKKVTGGNVAFSVQEQNYDTDSAENLLLNKLYFKNPIQVEAENNVNLRRNEIESFDGNYDYLSSDYISDFQTEVLKERSKNSEVYEKVYSKFEIDDKGIKPVATDEISTDNLRASIQELLTDKQYNNLKNYSVISRDKNIKDLFVDELRKPYIKLQSQERIYYQNNIDNLKPFKYNYQVIGAESIVTKEGGEQFLNINTQLYEKAQDASGYSFYRQIPTYQGDFNVITEPQPVNKFAQEEISNYLAPTETVEKTNNLYTKKELDTINEESFACN